VRLGARLPRSFFARPSTAVAPELLGRILLRVLPDGRRLAARIVEVEAYGPDDPASHAFRGRTARNDVMFGPPGRLYVYFTYGMHFCSNVVTGSDGEGSAVLLRAAEPIEGLEVMAVNRGVAALRLLCSGPARLTQAFAIDRADDGADLARGTELQLRAGVPVPARRVERTTRVGVNVGVEPRWRYLERGSPFVSPGRPATGSR
jgi:DNA-3-methyladenine glycosylase